MTIRFQAPTRQDPRLGRNLRHDSRSLAYPFIPAGLTVTSVRWDRYAPVFDQGQLGSCTGNAALGCLGTGADYNRLASSGVPMPNWTEDQAVTIYSLATGLDNFQGTYPPEDTGSDGLSVAKVLKNKGWISGYTHVLTGALGVVDALQTTPLIVGIPWYDSMFTLDADNIAEIGPGATVAGGHELAVDEWDDRRSLFGFTNSWGTSWGAGGRFYMAYHTLDQLLKEQGDATVFTPITDPAPQPITDVALARLVSKEAHWLATKFPAIGSVQAQREVRRYIASQGL